MRFPGLSREGKLRRRGILSAAALVLALAGGLAAHAQGTGQVHLGKCANLRVTGGVLCEEIGAAYIYINQNNGVAKRLSLSQASSLARYNLTAPTATMANSATYSPRSGPRPCSLSAPGSIACSGGLSSRMTGSRSPGFVSVCSGGQCISGGR